MPARKLQSAKPVWSTIAVTLIIVLIMTLAGQPGRAEERFVFNGKPIDRQQYEGILLYQQGLRQLRSNDNKGAVDNLTKASTMFPGFAPIHHNLGVALAKTGQPQEAIKEFEKAKELDPTLAASWMSLGFIYQTEGRLDDAISTFKEYLQRFPKDTDATKIRSLLQGLEKETNSERSNKSAFQDSSDDYLREVTRDGVIRWKLSRMPLRVFVADGTGVQGFKPEYAKLLRQSFLDWSRASKGRVSFNFVTDEENSDIRCSWTSDPSQLRNIAEAGETRFDFGKVGIVSCTIKFLTVPMKKMVPVTYNRMRTIFLHEIGHALGLAGHTTNPQDTMFYSAALTDNWRDLSERDARTLIRLYSLSDKNAK